MKRLSIAFAAATLLLFANRSWSAMGKASIQGTKEDSDITGELKFEDTPKGLKISGSVDNISSGDHGFHIHEFGDCGDEGKNAGSHFNPDQKPHGHAMKDGSMKVHPGDMGNLTVNEKGSASIDLLIPGVSLTGGKYAVSGRTVIIHDKKDDFGQPTGNAGNRIACGPIVLVGK